jgi:hypothetical protein
MLWRRSCTAAFATTLFFYQFGLLAYFASAKAEPVNHSGFAVVVICFPPRSRFHILSCDVRPIGRGLTFVPGDVPTRIRTITIRHSLLPTSQTRTAKDRPCGLFSPKGAIRGFHVPSVRVHRVRCLLLTGRFADHESRTNSCSTHLHYLLVQARQPFALVEHDGLYRRFTYVHPTDYLALIRLVAARRVRLLRLIPRALRHFVSLSGPLFIQAPRFTQ